ncbi:heme-binding protein [Mycolicibacterium palauense]|uniref:heme-binding protein n=1 Tax=Mycolicibacterium palauense TaxID=2034511 RepID=UPI000BFEBCEB|nr:heme-binding protein [Mycolicibacterium palauense]
MSFTVRGVSAGVVGAAAAALFLGSAGTAVAEPPLPPNCTAADAAGIMTGVSAATSAYLFTHPDVNAFFTGLRGQSRDDLREEVVAYMDAHPQVHNELRAIRQPITDFRNRCDEPLLEAAAY